MNTSPPQPGPDESRALKLWVVLARAYAAVEAHARSDIEQQGLTLAEFGVLETLYRKGPMLLGEVQRRILVSSGGITYLVDRLEEKGLVERRDCPDDRRARFAALTAAGEALIAEIFPRHIARIDEAVAGLDCTEQELAIQLLRSLGRHAASVE